MASRDLLELLGRGAAFGGRSDRRVDDQRRKSLGNVKSSINFFAAATAGEKRRRRESFEDEVVRADIEAGRDSSYPKLASNKASPNSPSVKKPRKDRGVPLFSTSGLKRTERGAESGDAGEDGAKRSAQIHSEEVACFRRRMGIRVKGECIADPIQTFLDMPEAGTNGDAVQIRRLVLKNVEESRWKEPTAVQMQALPVLLAGRDLLAAAPTGSGKTAAFVIPMILRLAASEARSKRGGVRGILLSPTRELAAQIHRDVVRLAKGRKLRVCLLTKAGAVKAAAAAGIDRKNSLSGYDIVVTTPMRIVGLLREGAVSLASVEMIVLDEADKLFDTGTASGNPDKAFVGQVDEVLAACSHRDVQRALFSATIGQHVRELAETVLHDPILLSVGTDNAGAVDIDQRLLYVGREEGKLLAMRQLVHEGLHPPVLVFLQSKDRAQELFHELVYDGINADVIHASRTQEQRDRIIQRFRTGDIWVLICTDLMARGIDFKGVNMVINYDFPQSAVSYIHRIGRTGRAGRHGVAVTLFTESDMDSLRSVANVMRLSGCEVPDWMLDMKRRRGARSGGKSESATPRRKAIATVSKLNSRKSRRLQLIANNGKAAPKSSRKGAK